MNETETMAEESLLRKLKFQEKTIQWEEIIKIIDKITWEENLKNKNTIEMTIFISQLFLHKENQQYTQKKKKY